MIGEIFHPRTDRKWLSLFFQGLCYPRARSRLTPPLLRQVESRHSLKVILVDTRVEFAFYFLNNTNALRELKCVCLMTNHVGITRTSKLFGSSIQDSFGMLVSDRTKKIRPNDHQEFCNRIKHLHSPTLPHLLFRKFFLE